MAGLINAPWNNSAPSAQQEDGDLAAKIGAMSIRDLKGFLRERQVTPDAGIVEKAELRNLAFSIAGVKAPEPPLPKGWKRYELEGRPHGFCVLGVC